MIVLCSGSSGGGSGKCIPRYFRSTGLAGSRQLSFNPTEIYKVNDEMRGNIYIIVAVSEMWINSPSCSTGWRTCLCLQRDRSCSKTASRWGMFSSSPSGLTAENTTNVLKKLVDEIWPKFDWMINYRKVVNITQFQVISIFGILKTEFNCRSESMNEINKINLWAYSFLLIPNLLMVAGYWETCLWREIPTLPVNKGNIRLFYYLAAKPVRARVWEITAVHHTSWG